MTGTVIKSAVKFALRRLAARSAPARHFWPPCPVIVLPVVRIDRGPDDDKPRRGARRRRLTKEGIWHG